MIPDGQMWKTEPFLVEHRIVIAAPIEKVWSVTIDIASWSAWCPTIDEARLVGVGALAVGSPFRLKQPLQRSRLWQVERLCPPTVAEWRTVDGESFRATHDLSVCGGRTVSRLRLTAGARRRLTRWPMRWVLTAAIAAENRALKKVCEPACPDPVNKMSESQTPP